MSNQQDLALDIRRIQAEHYLDGDGGYAAVAQIRAYLHSLEGHEQKVLLDVLRDFVDRREKDVWSVAWEALVQEQATDVAAAMLSTLRSSPHDPEWDDCIVLGLLRLGSRDGLAFYGDYIKRRLTEAGPLILPLAAALVRVSPDDAIEIASDYLAAAKQRRLESRVETYAVAFVRHYLAIDEHLLARLVGELDRRDPVAAKWFSLVLNACLAKPWMEKELGKDRSLRLRNQVTAARDAV